MYEVQMLEDRLIDIKGEMQNIDSEIYGAEEEGVHINKRFEETRQDYIQRLNNSKSNLKREFKVVDDQINKEYNRY